MVAGLWLLAPRFWRGDYRHYVDQMYGWTGLSRPARRGMYRATLVTAISNTMLFGGALSLLIAVQYVRLPHPAIFLAIAAILGGLLFFAAAVPLIIYFNIPKFLVIPHTRQQIGLAVIRRRARRIRRAERAGRRAVG